MYFNNIDTYLLYN